MSDILSFSLHKKLIIVWNLYLIKKLQEENIRKKLTLEDYFNRYIHILVLLKVVSLIKIIKKIID